MLKSVMQILWTSIGNFARGRWLEVVWIIFLCSHCINIRPVCCRGLLSRLFTKSTTQLSHWDQQYNGQRQMTSEAYHWSSVSVSPSVCGTSSTSDKEKWRAKLIRETRFPSVRLSVRRALQLTQTNDEPGLSRKPGFRPSICETSSTTDNDKWWDFIPQNDVRFWLINERNTKSDLISWENTIF